METPQSTKRKVELRDLYPTLTDKELKEAEENLRRYFKVALEIHNECEYKDKTARLT